MAREMKDSQKNWIGRIPYNWELKRIKNIIQQSKDGIKIGPFGSALTNKTIEEGKYNVYSQANLIASDFSGTKNTIDSKTFEELKGYEVFPDDVCLSMMGTIGKCKKVPKGITRGIMDSHLIKIRLSETVDSRFFEYVYDKDLGGVCFAQMQYDKKGFIMDGLNTSIVKNLYFPLPPRNEQIRIADYLDKECSRIDAAIEQTRASIEEYKKLKQAVITKAVTKGIRPDRQMKDSGIEWIGEIPANWRVQKLKYSIKWKSEKGQPNATVLSLYRDYGVIPKDSRDDNYNVTSLDTSTYKVVSKGDLVINKMKAWQGSMAISDYEGIVSPAYHVCIITNPDIQLKYLHYLLRNHLYLPEYKRLSTGMRIGQWDLGFDDFKDLPFILPPVKEQVEIVNYLEDKTTEIDTVIEQKEQLLVEMESYKKSLIFEYVTGKKEVPA